MQDSPKSLILKLFDIGAIEFGAFKFKHHQKFPDAPLAPMKINLRTPGHPTSPGKLTPKIVDAITFQFIEIIKREKIQFDYIAGIPHTGDPFARTLSAILDKPLLTAEKIEMGEKRKIGQIISSRDIQPRQSVLLIDDVITRGHSKKEAVRRFEEAGLKIAAVILFVDREEGGMEIYRSLGYKIFAATTISEILNIGLLETKISPTQYAKCAEYLKISKGR